jgi:hypothetical protein
MNSDSDKGRESSSNHPIITTGKGDTVILNSPKVTIEIKHWNVESKLISTGPLYFPVLPTLAIPNYSRKNHVKSPNEITMYLEIKFLDDIEVDVSKIKIITEDNEESYPTAYEDFSSKEHNPTEIIKRKYENPRKGPLFQALFVHYPVSTDVDSFRLILSGLKVGEENVAFPSIRFKKASGYSYGLEP